MSEENMSSTAEPTAGEPDSAIKNEVTSTASLGSLPTSPIPTSLSDVLATFMNASMENSALLTKISQENSALFAKFVESSEAKFTKLSTEVADLRKEIADLRNSPATTNVSMIVNDFSTFTCFPKLALELRLKIWKFAIHEPRVVEVRVWFRECGNYKPASFEIYNNPPPAVLQVNLESRKEALQYYQLGSLGGEQFPTYINLEADVLLFEKDNLENWKILESTGWFGKDIRRVAIPMGIFHQTERYLKQFVLSGVTEIMLVDESHIGDRAEYLKGRKHLDLITLSPLDLVKRDAYLGNARGESEVVNFNEYNVPLLKVEKLTVLVKNSIETRKSKLEPLGFDKDELDKFNPLLKVARLKFREPYTKKNEAKARGGRQIQLI